ncbi:MAG: anti-sigma factor antagonist [Agathobacter sp.]
MEQNYEISGNRMIYHMPLELDHHSAAKIRTQIDCMIDAGNVRELVLDFSGTDFMDSSGVGVVIGRHKKLMLYGGKVMACGVNERIGKLFGSSGLDRIIARVEV